MESLCSLIHCYFLLVQKVTPDLGKRNSPFSEGVFQLNFATTVVNCSGTLITSPLVTLKAQTVRMKRHEKQMQKSQWSRLRREAVIVPFLNFRRLSRFKRELLSLFAQRK